MKIRRARPPIDRKVVIPKKRFELREGHEVRGMMIRIYPTREQDEALRSIERTSRSAWNWLVKQVEDVLAARAALAVARNLVPPKPARPEDYDGLSPDESKEKRAAWGRAIREWHGLVYKATKDLPECAFRPMRDMMRNRGAKHDYQLLTSVIDDFRGDVEEREGTADFPKINATVLQAISKNYFQKSDRRKKFRKKHDAMPIQTRTGTCFESGQFGARGRTHASANDNFYDCRIKINGLVILGRLPARAPWGRVLEGVSVTRKADGWWASIKQEIPVREVQKPDAGTEIGIDVGLVNLVAYSEPVEVQRCGVVVAADRVLNPRGAAYAERIAGRQAFATTIEDPEARERHDRKTWRLQLSAQRAVRHLIYNEVVKPLARFETIKIEALTAKIGQMGSDKQSAMRLVRTMLIERYGEERVREVDCRFTSQDCSQCGHRSKESWSYMHGRFGKCPACHLEIDRDVNAARNVVARPAISLAS